MVEKSEETDKKTHEDYNQKEMKHAFLIIAHGQLALLKKLIELLDTDDRAVCYVHIDSKVVVPRCLTDKFRG